MPLNLDPLKKFAEREMVDTVLIERDIAGSKDDVLNTDTGEKTPPPVDYETVYEGKCFLVRVNVFPQEQLEGGQEVHELYYNIYMPLTVEGLKPWDRVTVTGALRDPELVGKQFWIENLAYTTFAAVREARLFSRDLRYYP